MDRKSMDNESMINRIKNVYTDGGVIGPNPSAIGGTWCFVCTDNEDRLVIYESGIIKPFRRLENGDPAPVTNNNSEMVALIRGLQSLPEGWSGNVYSDSKLALGWTFWRWKHELCPATIWSRAQEAVERLDAIKVTHLDGHPTKAQLKSGIGKRGNPVSVWNVMCDEVCKSVGDAYKIENEITQSELKAIAAQSLRDIKT